MATLGTKELTMLAGAHPDLQRLVKAAFPLIPGEARVIEVRRTIERQKQLVAQGASKTMKSRHLTGHAVDIVPLENGKVSWRWPLFWPIVEAMEKTSKRLGIPHEAGARWKSFPDGPHHQLPWVKYP